MNRSNNALVQPNSIGSDSTLAAKEIAPTRATTEIRRCGTASGLGSKMPTNPPPQKAPRPTGEQRNPDVVAAMAVFILGALAGALIGDYVVECPNRM